MDHQAPLTNDWNSFLSNASSDVRRLSAVDRFSSIPVTFRENVAEHSFWVAFYALMLHEELDGPSHALEPLLAYAIIHDLPECLTGDVVRTFKYSSPEMKSAVDKAERSQVQKLPVRIQRVYLNASLSADENSEFGWYIQAVVKTADFLSLYEYMWREKNRGNRETEGFHKRMNEDLRQMATHFKDLSQLQTSHDRNRIYESLSMLYHEMVSSVITPEFTTK